MAIMAAALVVASGVTPFFVSRMFRLGYASAVVNDAAQVSSD